MGAPSSRAGTAADAVLGVQPRLVLEPASVPELVEAVGQAARESWHLAAVGGATALGLGAPPRALDAVVRTRGLARILEYAPADMVLIAEAGVTLAAIQAAAAAHRQRLALDAPHPARATVGGLVATGASGPLRARHGTVRDLIIGVALVRADGTLARSGGKVVKNVAGFDLPKVACGSLGTLGVVATANFRLHPLPEATAALRLPGLSAGQLVAVLARLREAQLEPASACSLHAAPGRHDLTVVFEGFGQGVAQQLERLEALAQKGRLDCQRLDPAQAAAARATHDAVREGEGFRARVSSLPSRLAAVEALLAPALAALEGGAFLWYPTVGLGWLAGTPRSAAALAPALTAARQGLAAGGGALVLEDAPPAVRAAVEVWGPPPASFHLMQRLKHNFDPGGRLNPGRFVGGL
jgi:glycolate oxidase FAD binding subunit